MKTNYFKHVKAVAFSMSAFLTFNGASAYSNSAWESLQKKEMPEITIAAQHEGSSTHNLPATRCKAFLQNDDYLALMNEAPDGPIGGIAENNLQTTGFKLYPNPNDGRFTLQFSLNTYGDLDVRLTDIIGKEIADQKVEGFTSSYTNQFDLGSKEKGLYILFIEQNQKQLVKKVIVN